MKLDENEAMKLVENVLQVHCGIKQPIQPDAHLREDLGLDSVGILTLMVELENSLHKQLEENPENPPQTVRQLAQFLTVVVNG